jgi:hypothetical protein
MGQVGASRDTREQIGTARSKKGQVGPIWGK